MDFTLEDSQNTAPDTTSELESSKLVGYAHHDDIQSVTKRYVSGVQIVCRIDCIS